MIYAQDVKDLFAPARLISPYTVDQQLDRCSYEDTPRSVDPLFSELYGQQLINGGRRVAVPYLNKLIEFTYPDIPDLDAAKAFAQTTGASEAISAIRLIFQAKRDFHINSYPGNTFTVNQVSDILYLSSKTATTLINLADLEPLLPQSSATKRFATSNLERLYEWHYPASFPDKPALTIS